jgi:hypothetical protein
VQHVIAKRLTRPTGLQSFRHGRREALHQRGSGGEELRLIDRFRGMDLETGPPRFHSVA